MRPANGPTACAMRTARKGALHGLRDATISFALIFMSASADGKAMGERNNIALLSAQFTEKLQQAHSYLRAEMTKLGMLEEDGWKIVEVMRECAGGSELVLRPIHMKLEAPEGLECIVWFIEEPTTRIGAECAPALSGVRWKAT